MFYFAKSPFWLRFLYKDRIWKIGNSPKKLFLTFDDGPHETITPNVLELLKKHNAKATFFCIGKNVEANPEVYKRIIDEGHAIGNHTFNHLNGWKTDDDEYLQNIFKAKQHIDSNFFRPPYGRITRFQFNQLRKPRYNLKTIMWSVLSGDFDTKISKEKCLQNILLNVEDGAIIVFHDSEKAKERMMYALTETLEVLSKKGYTFEKITDDLLTQNQSSTH